MDCKQRKQKSGQPKKTLLRHALFSRLMKILGFSIRLSISKTCQADAVSSARAAKSHVETLVQSFTQSFVDCPTLDWSSSGSILRD
jgi:hypothetical protein